MLLTPAELGSLTSLVHSSPHTLLGMHPLGDGSGVVVRVMIPHAVKVAVVPVHESNRPRLELKRLGDTAVFEGTTTHATAVYAYDLIITWADGSTTQGRDPYSFWPTVGDTDLHLFNEGNHRKLYDTLGAHLTRLDGVAGVAFAVWAPNARRVSVIGDFNGWDGRRHLMRMLGHSGVWELFFPGVNEGSL